MVATVMHPPRNDMNKRPVAASEADQSVSTSKNVGSTERVLSLVGGSVLAVVGLSSKDTLAKVLLPIIGGGLIFRGATGHCSAYKAMGVSTADGPPATAVPAQRGDKIEHSVTINRPAAELFRFWRQFDRLPRFMRHLQSVDVQDHKRSHWVAEGPLGTTVSWDAEIIGERENELIAWRSLPGSTVDTAGSVHFRPATGGRGTVVAVSLKYNPPAGALGATIASLFGVSPETHVRDDLGRFKQLMETGETSTAKRAVQRL